MSVLSRCSSLARLKLNLCDYGDDHKRQKYETDASYAQRLVEAENERRQCLVEVEDFLRVTASQVFWQ